MKKFLFIFSLLLYFPLNAQYYFSWVNQYKSSIDYADYLSKIAKDDDGNIYMIGRTRSPAGIDVDPSPNFSVICENAGGSGTYGKTFVVKQNHNGKFLWAKQISNHALDLEIDLVVRNNRIYVLTDKSELKNITYNSYLTVSIFDSDGNLIIETPLIKANGRSLDVDDSGNILITGYAVKNIEFVQPYNTAFNVSTNFLLGFVVQLDADLKVNWTKHYQDLYTQELKAKFDSQGNVFFLGNETYDDNYKIFKYDRIGNLIFGNTLADQKLNDFALDSQDNLIISGHWNAQFDSIDVDPQPTNYYLPSNTYQSQYVLFLNSNLQIIEVKKYLNDGNSNFPVWVRGITIDEDSNLYLMGSFHKSFDADPETGTEYLKFGNGYSEGFSIEFKKDRSYSKSLRLGSDTYDYPNSHTAILGLIRHNKDYYYMGTFDWNTDFDPSGNNHFLSTLNLNQLNSDGYLLKLANCHSKLSVNSDGSICEDSAISLSASGGTSYSWSGPNGFTSTQQNPVIPNATAAHAGTYTCQISGTGGCDGTFTVEVKVEDKTPPVPNVAALPMVTGNCKTIISTIPTANDGCMGSIKATTTDPMQYSQAGNFVITWKYDDGNGNIATQTQNVTITSEPLPSANSTQSFCKITTPNISDLQITGSSIKWYDDAGNPLSVNTLLKDGTKYFATQTVNGCESAKTEITVTINDPVPPTGNTQQDFCSAQNPTLSNLVVNGQNTIWYDSSGAVLAASTPLSDGKTYYATQTVSGCESTQKLAVKVTVANGGIPADDYSVALCNDTTANTRTINLNDYKTNLASNTSDYVFEFFDTANQTISNHSNVTLNIGSNIFNVKISNALGCFVYAKLTLILNPKPILNLPETAEFCNGKAVNLNAGSGFSSYEWIKDSDPTVISTKQILSVSEVAKYTVIVKNAFGCENTSSVIVTKSSFGTVTGVQIVNNTATVIMSNSGDFLHSLDNAVWQTSNVFSNLSNGNHTVYVKTSGDCVIGQMNFTIFNVPNSFTPNADGINDTWKIDGIENYPNSEIKVYDRNGNMVLSKLTNGSFEWDGKYNSRPLPTGNYWYIIKVSDGRILNGWLLIKNRN